MKAELDSNEANSHSFPIQYFTPAIGFLPLRLAMERMGFGRTTMKELIKSGDLEAMWYGGRIYIAEVSINRFIERAVAGEFRRPYRRNQLKSKVGKQTPKVSA